MAALSSPRLGNLADWLVLQGETEVCFSQDKAIACDRTQRWFSSGPKGRETWVRGERSALKATWRILAGALIWNHRPCMLLANYWVPGCSESIVHVHVVTLTKLSSALLRTGTVNGCSALWPTLLSSPLWATVVCLTNRAVYQQQKSVLIAVGITTWVMEGLVSGESLFLIQRWPPFLCLPVVEGKWRIARMLFWNEWLSKKCCLIL